MNTRTNDLFWSETVHDNGWFEAYPEFQKFDFTLDRHKKKKTSIARISEYLPHLGPKGRFFYNEYVKKYKIARGMEGVTTGDDGLFHGLTLMRPASLPDVSDKERLNFKRLPGIRDRGILPLTIDHWQF